MLQGSCYIQDIQGLVVIKDVQHLGALVTIVLGDLAGLQAYTVPGSQQ